MKTVVITGASSGIGKSLCKCYAENAYFVFGSVRNKKDANELDTILGEKGKAVIFDVTKRAEIKKAITVISKMTSHVDILINNAGIALPAPLEITHDSDFTEHFSINVLGVLNCVQLFLPLLKKKSDQSKPSQIINISSGAGKRGSPFLGAYCMSKHALEGLSKVLRQEMLLYGIQVCVIAPGSIKSKIWKKGGENAESEQYMKSEYSGYLNKFKSWLDYIDRIGVSSDKFALQVFKISQKYYPPVRVVIHPRPFLALFLQDIMPTRFFNRLYARKLGFPEQ